MAYKFELENKNYEDYASGRVLYNQKGATAFPVRLASEIFLRCQNLLQRQEVKGPYVLYDPCCGGAFLLTSLGFLHGESIRHIYASDVDTEAVMLAERNLSLLYPSGMDMRIRQIKGMIDEFHKPSHVEALESALRLRERAVELGWTSSHTCFAADITGDDYKKITDGRISEVDMVICDLPYGSLVNWKNGLSQERAVEAMLNNLLYVLSSKSVVAIISGEKIPLTDTRYKKAEGFKLGKRYITILQPV